MDDEVLKTKCRPTEAQRNMFLEEVMPMKARERWPAKMKLESLGGASNEGCTPGGDKMKSLKKRYDDFAND